MTALSAALAVLAAALAWPVPRALARASWPARDPLVALLCWQAVGLAGGLSLIGAPIVYGLAPSGSSLLGASAALAVDRLAAGLSWDHLAALAVGSVIAARLVWSLATCFVHISRTRSRQRAMLGVVARTGDDGHVHVIDVAETVAFSIPGGPPMIVVSQGMVNRFRGTELAAVIAHEQAHLAVRHDLLLLSFASWRHALPWLPSTSCAYRAVHELVELHADDSACNSTSRLSLARALARTDPAVGDGNVAGPGPQATVTRVRRLSAAPMPLTTLVRTVIVATAAALVIVPTAVLLSTG